jgi:hypothetical protein
MTDDELAAIEERHRTYPISTASTAIQVCPKDMEGPCEAMRLVAEVRRQLRHMVRIHAALAERAETDTERWAMHALEQAMEGQPADDALTRMPVAE